MADNFGGDDCNHCDHFPSERTSKEDDGSIASTKFRLGRVFVFDHQGNTLCQRRLASGVTSLVASTAVRKVAVGCEDGTVMLLDGSGNTLTVGNMRSEVRAVIFNGDGVIAGSTKGQVKKYPVPHNQ